MRVLRSQFGQFKRRAGVQPLLTPSLDIICFTVNGSTYENYWPDLFFFILSEKVVAFSDSTTKCLLNTQDKIFILWKSPVNTFSGKSTTIRLNWKLISNKKQKGHKFPEINLRRTSSKKEVVFSHQKSSCKSHLLNDSFRNWPGHLSHVCQKKDRQTETD